MASTLCEIVLEKVLINGYLFSHVRSRFRVDQPWKQKIPLSTLTRGLSRQSYKWFLAQTATATVYCYQYQSSGEGEESGFHLENWPEFARRLHQQQT